MKKEIIVMTISKTFPSYLDMVKSIINKNNSDKADNVQIPTNDHNFPIIDGQNHVNKYKLIKHKNKNRLNNKKFRGYF